MSELRDYVCWDVERVISTIQTEAVVASSAVFLATHTPLQIQRAEIDGRSFNNTGRMASEKDVLKDFLSRKTATGTVLMPIVGESGTGKSHLVRWVGEKLPPSDKRKVIYLEKSKTSLRHVIESLLEGVDDEEISQIRADVRSSTSSSNASSLALRLINELVVALAGTTSSGLRGRQRQLAGPRGLALILQDPVLQEQMLEDGKFIPRFAEHMLSDRGAEAERPPHFSVADLPLSVASAVDGVAAPTRPMLRLLLSKPEMREAAVELLNEYWEKSVQATSHLGGGRVLDAMKKVREIYARQGKEIVLLIEDFALIQGVQRDLLDAITETSQRDGQTVLAPMRTLLAITSGYFHDLPETALTRIAASTGGHVYNLDLVLDSQDSTEAIASFAGRYLNAARVGRQELEAHTGKVTPNRCTECPVRLTCHDAFGKSAEGYGLYPFNRSALLRTIHAVAPAEQPHAFVPRTVLSRALIPVLTEGYDSIQEGVFPDEQFRSRFKINRDAGDLPLASRVREQIEDLDQADGPRREKLLEFWANSPTELVNLDPGIATAFSLPDLPVETGYVPEVPTTPATPPTTPPVTPPLTQGLPTALKKRVDAIESWSTGDAGLGTNEARTVRSMVSRAVIYRQDWLHPPVKPLGISEAEKAAGWTVKASTVSIEGAAAEALARGDSSIIFKRTPANAEFFKSLVLLDAESPHGVRSQDVVRLSSMADRYARVLRERRASQSQLSDDDLVAGLRVSLMGATLAGRAHPGMPLAQLHAAAFNPGQSWPRSDVSSRVEMWQRSLNGHLAKRGSLIDTLRGALGVGQGAGAVQVIDAARALPLLRRAAQRWELDGSDLPTWAQPAAQPLAGWRVLLPAQHAHLVSLLQEIRRCFPRGERSADLLNQLEASLRVAAELGLEGGSQVPAMRQLMAQIQDADWASLTVLERDLAKLTPDLEGPDALAAMLQGAAPLRDPHLAGMQQLLKQADAFLGDALRSAQERGQTAASTASQQLHALMDAWQQIAQVARVTSKEDGK